MNFLWFPQKYPPRIPSSIPFLGHAVAFGRSPIEFLEQAYEKVRVVQTQVWANRRPIRAHVSVDVVVS